MQQVSRWSECDKRMALGNAARLEISEAVLLPYRHFMTRHPPLITSSVAGVDLVEDELRPKERAGRAERRAYLPFRIVIGQSCSKAASAISHQAEGTRYQHLQHFFSSTTTGIQYLLR